MARNIEIFVKCFEKRYLISIKQQAFSTYYIIEN